eukprot:TRINITY_DN68032_c5_g2_i5.p2 TRINITY_DN68032_c5_g2~~TRINITY_DN68032_c5_g2_i5.p2  ORF type:complete len:103 (-),score=4.83 TRINITY_DN68032_c5_g2_i5:33-341(-)
MMLCYRQSVRHTIWLTCNESKKGFDVVLNINNQQTKGLLGPDPTLPTGKWAGSLGLRSHIYRMRFEGDILPAVYCRFLFGVVGLQISVLESVSCARKSAFLT